MECSLRSNKSCKNHIEFAPKESQTVHWAQYRAGTRARELEETEIDKMLEKEVIYLTEKVWEGLIVLDAKKDRSPRFCVDYQN